LNVGEETLSGFENWVFRGSNRERVVSGDPSRNFGFEPSPIWAALFAPALWASEISAAGMQ